MDTTSLPLLPRPPLRLDLLLGCRQSRRLRTRLPRRLGRQSHRHLPLHQRRILLPRHGRRIQVRTRKGHQGRRGNHDAGKPPPQRHTRPHLVGKLWHRHRRWNCQCGRCRWRRHRRGRRGRNPRPTNLGGGHRRPPRCGDRPRRSVHPHGGISRGRPRTVRVVGVGHGHGGIRPAVLSMHSSNAERDVVPGERTGHVHGDRIELQPDRDRRGVFGGGAHGQERGGDTRLLRSYHAVVRGGHVGNVRSVSE
mmetsp:Transcript_13066/g.23702  ORF Transcript_13066/g.23702 Transcript_13066/m.23702 type:complete len:250 (+) Transcript_13066:592-1341(+)